MIALQLLGMYPSWVSWTFTMILNVSVSLAMYSLVVFYSLQKNWHCTSHFQSLYASKGLRSSAFGSPNDILLSHHFWLDVEHIQEAIKNVLVCLETIVFSVLQHYVFHRLCKRDE
ncbi:hypothetical protein RJ640_030184 [Escallonia rubra]|uniref:Uncharacterized protein n=1 Tax=Escallonia rubra TaxID=112253 RepID=A0AA88QV58_9ASTE|nr:hypothetical protein RJ640_030184 [Escallonia rubra]